MAIILTRWILLFSALLLGSQAYAQTVHIAVAANFTKPVQTIAQQFEASTHNKVILSFASSGKLFAQIQHGAPYDVFLSADTAKPLALEQSGFGIKGSIFTYAQGNLVLWSPVPNFISSDGVSTLKKANFQHLAIANPKLAPYGSAAITTMKNLKVYSSLNSKFVQGENIAQAYQFVVTGNAKLGFVALSQVMENGKITRGSGWIVPKDLHPAIRQDAVLLKHGQDNNAAKTFLNYLQSASATKIINAYGYYH